MYVRVTSFKVNASRLKELPDKIRELQPVARGLPGVVDIYAAWRGDGQGVITAVYRSKADADAAIVRIAALWGHLTELLEGAPRTDIYDSVEHIAG
jgi:hypothetical protein